MFRKQLKADTGLPRPHKMERGLEVSRPGMNKLRASRAIVLGVPLSLCLWGLLYLIWKLFA